MSSQDRRDVVDPFGICYGPQLLRINKLQLKLHGGQHNQIYFIEVQAKEIEHVHQQYSEDKTGEPPERTPAALKPAHRPDPIERAGFQVEEQSKTGCPPQHQEARQGSKRCVGDRPLRQGTPEGRQRSPQAQLRGLSEPKDVLFQHGLQIGEFTPNRRRPGVVSSLAASKNPEDDDTTLDFRSWLPIAEPPKGACGTFVDCRPTRQGFTMDFVVGKGGFGKVWRVREKKTGRLYAMKQMLKSKVIVKKSVSSIMNEIELLSKLRHPFLVNMSYAFQDRYTLYLVIDYLNGGDLRYHITRQRAFSESDCRFLICNMLIGLEYLHSKSIIHRDLKPENLVFCKDGYLCITDLGISREWSPNNGADTSGTPGYMSPEVITRNDHSFSADFFAVGVIAYELMTGRRPYTGRSRQEIRERILAKQARVDSPPSGWSIESIDFVNRLIQRKPENRLGCKGIRDVKGHPWLKRVDWKAMESKTMKAPFIPRTVEEDYANYQSVNISSDTTVNTQDNESQLMVRNAAVQELFRGYEYNIDQRDPPRGSVKPVAAFAHRGRQYVNASRNY